jgi:hypothetical protein
METGAIITASPARQSDAQRPCLRQCQNPRMAGFCQLAVSLQTPNLGIPDRNRPTVSGGYLKYSRFRETSFYRYWSGHLGSMSWRRGAWEDAVMAYPSAPLSLADTFLRGIFRTENQLVH